MGERISAMMVRKKFGEILNKVTLLEKEYIIERSGKEIARLGPLRSRRDKEAGKLDFRKAAGLGREIWKDVDADAYVARERREWT